jgi:hypothetical protein
MIYICRLVGLGPMASRALCDCTAHTPRAGPDEEGKNIIKETKNLFTKIFSSKETN